MTSERQTLCEKRGILLIELLLKDRQAVIALTFSVLTVGKYFECINCEKAKFKIALFLTGKKMIILGFAKVKLGKLHLIIK